MEKEDKHIQTILKQSARLQAPTNLGNDVLKQFHAQQASPFVASPLIPTWVWWALAVISAVSIAWAYLNQPTIARPSVLPFDKLFEWNSSISELLAQSNSILIISLLALLATLMANALMINSRRFA